jgi:dTDP-glucose 4,6-dehydratase
MIHAAAETSLSLLSEKPRLGFDVIVEGTKRALEFAKASGLRQFLLTSSGAVYGRQPDKMTHIPEEYLGAPDPTSQLSAYGKGKRAAESLCATYSQEGSLQAKIARGFAFVGPYMDVDAYYAIGNFIRDALKGGPIQVRGDGTAYRSYMYGADLAEWLWIILLKGKVCYPYNVGSENRISIKELAETVRDTVNPKAEIHISVKSAPGRAPEQYVPSTRRARAELGLNETVDLRKAIQLTAESLTENHFQKT